MTPNDLTLVVTLRTRHAYVKRLIDYYADFNCTKIFIDSSESPYQEPTGDFEYHYFGPLLFYHKVNLAMQGLVTTPYCVLLCDDNFIFKESIEPCRQFLERNKSFAICLGELYFLQGSGSLRVMYPQTFMASCTYESPKKLTERLKFHTVFHCPVDCGVIRAEVARKCWKTLSDNRCLQAIKTIDRTFSAIAQTEGRIKFLNIPYQMQEPNLRIATVKKIKAEFLDLKDYDPSPIMDMFPPGIRILTFPIGNKIVRSWRQKYKLTNSFKPCPLQRRRWGRTIDQMKKLIIAYKDEPKI